jgi:hypothetical protein
MALQAPLPAEQIGITVPWLTPPVEDEIESTLHEN